MNNKKLFKGALVLFASILMAVSCSSGDKTGSTGNEQEGGVTTKTLTKADFLAKLKAITFGENKNGGIGTWSFTTITDIKAGVAQKSSDAAEIVSKADQIGAGNTSIAAVNTAIEKEIAKLATSGYKVTLTTKLTTNNGSEAQEIVLSVSPVPATDKVKYQFEKDLTEALTAEEKTVVKIKLKPGNSKTWAD